MKDTLTDANFPRTADHRVYHLGLRPGEVANRIVTVGSPSRAKAIATHLDQTPEPFQLLSERGFNTITGRYQGVPVTIISIGMGAPNMDFFVREARECLSGDMLIIRLGSCGGLKDTPVGTVVCPRACVAVSRNVDFDFLEPSESQEPAYRISKPVSADLELDLQLRKALELAKPARSETLILADTVNASADSFYSSQGRQTSFPDHNSQLIDQLLTSVDDLATLEMETHHLYHLAACWGKNRPPQNKSTSPLTTGPVEPISTVQSNATSAVTVQLAASDTLIRVAAVQMVFASRTSQDFITPSQVTELERWTGQAALNALIQMKLSPDRIHDEKGSVWELSE
ncbi:nucleoside phosphorylase domain-containing protein [Mycena floridula]|nr:nucleoside phosphorylase domain-containing protein [Mycena floridula]